MLKDVEVAEGIERIKLCCKKPEKQRLGSEHLIDISVFQTQEYTSSRGVPKQ